MTVFFFVVVVVVFYYQSPTAIPAEKKSGANLKTQSVRGYKSYRLPLVKRLTLEEKKKEKCRFSGLAA